jgi:hypothetical protein
VIAAGLTLAPATLLMLVVGPGIGILVRNSGPKVAMILGAVVAVCGLSLFLVYRATSTEVVVASAISMVGAVSIIIPIVNMVTVSLPDETVATGLGLNTMLRNMGGALGPVIATTIMTTYSKTVPVGMEGGVVIYRSFPTSTAFDLVFYAGIAGMAAVIVLSLAVKNYTFKKT